MPQASSCACLTRRRSQQRLQVVRWQFHPLPARDCFEHTRAGLRQQPRAVAAMWCEDLDAGRHDADGDVGLVAWLARQVAGLPSLVCDIVHSPARYQGTCQKQATQTKAVACASGAWDVSECVWGECTDRQGNYRTPPRDVAVRGNNRPQSVVNTPCGHTIS